MSIAKVTICIPTHDRAGFLSQALSSVLNQDLSADEYIVAIADNASGDNTSNIVAEYGKRCQIVYHRHDEDIGQLANIRFVTQMCTTPYLVLLPDDDLLAPGHLKRVFAAVDAYREAALISSLAVIQPFPGAPLSQVHGVFLRANTDTSYERPYVWNQTEWLALSLLNTPLSLIGAVFQNECFRQCNLWKSYQLWGDRLLLAEMGLKGPVISLPWIGGYYRTGVHQIGATLQKTCGNEFASVSEEILAMCKDRRIPVVDFWIEQIHLSTPRMREHYLLGLKASLPTNTYLDIQGGVRRLLGRSLGIGGRLERSGIPGGAARFLRNIRQVVTGS